MSKQSFPTSPVTATLLQASFALLTLTTVACSQANFAAVDTTTAAAQTTPTPVTPPPTPVTPPVTYVTANGACASDSSTKILSCLTCEVPASPPPAPTLSTKAIQLMHIMEKACPVNNQYYGNKYKTPTEADMLARLNRCDGTSYPLTTPDSGQNDIVTRLLGGDSSLLRYMFTGFWYKPYYSDYFETYFGIQVGEAINIFCSDTANNMEGPVMPSTTHNNPYGPVYNPGDAIPEQYVLANTYRDQLRSCVEQSETNPWTPPAPGTPGAPTQKTCDWQTIQGTLDAHMISQAATWLSQGYTVGAEVSDQCLTVTSTNSLSNLTGFATIAGYLCQ